MRKPILIIEFPNYVPPKQIGEIMEGMRKLDVAKDYHILAWHTNTPDLKANVLGANWFTLKFVYGKAIEKVKKVWQDFTGAAAQAQPVDDQPTQPAQ